jgi:dienelactone hydrolase
MKLRSLVLVPCLGALLLAAEPLDYPQLRARIRKALYVPDPLPSLNPQKHGEFEPVPGIVAERVTYASQFGMRVPAIIYHPKQAGKNRPAFIVVNGHGGDKYTWYAYWAGILYARAGAVVLTYDPAGEGERNLQHKSGTRAHDRYVPPDEIGRRMGGLMITDVSQAVTYLSQRPDVDPKRIAAGGYSMGSFVLAMACAVETRLNACVLVGGGNLDGAGGYWETSSKKMCQGIPYQTLSFLGDRAAMLYALHAQRGATLIHNGSTDEVVSIPKVGAPEFFNDLRQRTIKLAGSEKNVFEFSYTPEGGHRPYFITRPVGEWLNAKLSFPNWKAVAGETHISDWAKANGVLMDRSYADEHREGGTIALGKDVPLLAPEKLNVLPAAEWAKQKDRFVLEKWLETVQANLAEKTPESVTLDMLKNIQANGFNKNTGGLYINWRYGSNPLQYNMKSDGNPDGPSVKPERHDVLTDLRYLHNLFLRKAAHPQDRQFDSEIARFDKIVKKEFAGTRNERGWIYDELMDMHHLSKDAFYRDTARGLANNYATTMAKPPIGIYYKTSKDHPNGYYRADLALEIGCALIQAAKEFNEPAWAAQGRKMVDFVYDHAYIRKYHAFPQQMDNALLPVHAFYREAKREGSSVRMGTMGQMIVSLLHAYKASGEKLYLDRATDMLDALTPERNLLRLWDAVHLGYSASAVFPGPGPANPGEPKLNDKKKESGRQAHMLEALVVANQVTNNRYKRLEDLMVRVILDKAYFAKTHGVPYETAGDWSPLPVKAGGTADWVTTEAMGITMMSLQQAIRK